MTATVRGDDQPHYERIYADLARKITTGELGYMEQLPALPELCRIYAVSETPVRRALDELARVSMVVKRRGRGQGTFVIKRMSRIKLRVLLIAGIDLSRSTVAACHEIFDLLDGIREAARQADCEVQQISETGLDALMPPDAATAYIVIAMTAAEYECGAQLAAQQQAPCVLINTPYPAHVCVRVDMEQGAFLAANYLAQLGHRRIAYVGASAGEWFAPRFSGYCRALAANDIALDPALVQHTDGLDPQQDQAALHTLLALPEPPTALFACSDYRALHLLACCKQSGIAVPQQISICGYDDIAVAADVEPALTTVRHQRQELGSVAIDLAIKLLQRDSPAPLTGVHDEVVLPELIVRNSCAAPRRQTVPKPAQRLGGLVRK